MKRPIEYLHDKDVVRVKTSDRYLLEEEIETAKECIEKMQEFACDRCLFDHRETTVFGDTLGSYDRPGVYETLGLMRSAKMAIVLRPEDNLHFYETVCQNRGWNVRVYNDYAAAMSG